MASATPAMRDRGDTAFFGHPASVGYLVAVEACWFFAYGGIQTLLTLYLTRRLFMPDHVGAVIGFDAYRTAMAAVFGALSPLALASQTFGLVTAAVYGVPILAGLVADRWAGQRRVALAGLVLMVAGHALLVSDATFLLGLIPAVLGAGLSKTCIAAQLGRSYAVDDPRRTRGFGFFYLAINTGSLLAPLIAGTLAQRIGWGWGFAAMAGGSLGALLAYLAGLRRMPADTVRTRPDGGAAPPALRPGDGRVLAALGVVILLDLLFVTAYNQSFNIFPLWADAHTDLRFGGVTMPVTWFVSLDGAFTILGTILSVRLWAWQARRGREPGDVRRMQIGFVLTVAAFLILALGAARTGPTPLGYPIAYFALVDLAVAWTDMVVLSLVSRAAPPALATTTLGAYYLATMVGNFTVGWLGGSYERVTPASFWLLHAAIAAAALPLLLLLGPWLRRTLAPRTAG